MQSALWGVWVSIWLVVAFFFCQPSPSLTHVRADVPPESKIPFSQTVAQKSKTILVSIRTMLAWSALAIVIALCFLQVTTVLPDYAHLHTAALVSMGVTVIGVVIASSVYRGRVTAKIEQMPTDEEEAVRRNFVEPGDVRDFYTASNDPMVVSRVSNAKLALNWAHRPARNYVWVAVSAFLVGIPMGIALHLF